MFQFGIGGIWVNPIGGNLATNPTPYELLTVQDVSVDISQDLKELVGQNKVADDVAPGQMKVTGKFTPGRIDIGLFNQMFFANPTVPGVKQIIKDEAGLVGSSPYNYAVTQLLTFTTDLGVRYASNGMALVRVITTPAAGQYTVSAGTYTFSAADTGKGVLVSYISTNATAGYTVTITNSLMGYGPIFELWVSQPYQSAPAVTTVPPVPNGIHLYCCRLSKLGQAMKNTDYLRPEMDFSAFANAAGQVGELFQTVA
jgi:hypothetical protein